MTDLLVDVRARTLSACGETTPCAIGRSGAIAAADKREGDGATPLGRWPLRTIMVRPGRCVPPPGLRLPWRWTRPQDGWSDGIDDPAYNQPVRHPHRWSAERLQRDDGLYDVIVTLGHNERPSVPGLGSAIFLHCWNDAAPTEGCVAVEKERLLRLVSALAPGDAIVIA